MAIEWFSYYETMIRLEGEQSEIDTILRSIEVADRVEDVYEYAEQTDVAIEHHP